MILYFNLSEPPKEIMGMNLEKRSMYFAICILSVITFLILFSGCSKESKIERHWKKGETYFSENKFKEAAIEYKNIIELGT